MRSRPSALATGAVLTLWEVNAFAQVAPPPYSTTVANDNVQLTTTVYTVPNGALVSGTDKSFQVSASVSSCNGKKQWTNAWLTNLTIWINGTAVERWTANPNNPVMSVGFAVNWDTTNFQNQTEPLIACTANAAVETLGPSPAPLPPVVLVGPDTLGPATVNTFVEVYNRGFAADIPQFADNISPLVAACYQQMNYGVDQYGSAGPGNCLTGLQNDTAYYFNGHGADIGMGTNSPVTCFGDYDTWSIYDGVFPYPADPGSDTNNVQLQRSLGLADGVPRVIFAFLDTCWTGHEGNMAGSFLCPGAQPTGLTDQAEMGWTGLSTEGWHQTFTPTFYAYLAVTWTVEDALVAAWNVLYNQFEDAPQNGIPQDAAPDDYFAVYGDPLTRMHGLYTGAAGQNKAWYSVSGGAGG